MKANRLKREDYFARFVHWMDIMLKPARRCVEIGAAEFPVAGYRDVIGVGPTNRLDVGIDVGDVTGAVNVLAANAANANDVAGCCHVEPRLIAHAYIAAAS